ncbi:hypothetical protein E2C01_064023 [Portunus trituberculatus]|uniref:Uncharacterized protein n=1 Tax=Portunus trituberculatus TaxID=210409 RepID=A0A5B7HF71_PORTR|nr:hypothetical protein [Portunus trituberculatus]
MTTPNTPNITNISQNHHHHLYSIPTHHHDPPTHTHAHTTLNLTVPQSRRLRARRVSVGKGGATPETHNSLTPDNAPTPRD